MYVFKGRKTEGLGWMKGNGEMTRLYYNIKIINLKKLRKLDIANKDHFKTFSALRNLKGSNLF